MVIRHESFTGFCPVGRTPDQGDDVVNPSQCLEEALGDVGLVPGSGQPVLGASAYHHDLVFDIGPQEPN